MTLRLDLAHPQPRPCRLGWVLLALGVATAVWAGWRHHTVSQALAEAQAATAPRAALTPALPPAKRAVSTAKASVLDAQARQALKADWAGLLGGLERQRPKDIALLSLEADPVRGGISLQANARDLSDVLAYLDGVAQAGLSQARLESHTAMEGEGESFIQFRAQARWPQARAEGMTEVSP
jgi:hypothetical protein